MKEFMCEVHGDGDIVIGAVFDSNDPLEADRAQVLAQLLRNLSKDDLILEAAVAGVDTYVNGLRRRLALETPRRNAEPAPEQSSTGEGT